MIIFISTAFIILTIGFSIIYLSNLKKCQNISLNLEKHKTLFDVLEKEHEELSAYVKSLEKSLTEEKVLTSEYKTKYEGIKEHTDEKIRLIEESQTKLKESFKALSLEALEKNNSHFLNARKRKFR